MLDIVGGALSEDRTNSSREMIDQTSPANHYPHPWGIRGYVSVCEEVSAHVQIYESYTIMSVRWFARESVRVVDLFCCWDIQT